MTNPNETLLHSSHYFRHDDDDDDDDDARMDRGNDVTWVRVDNYDISTADSAALIVMDLHHKAKNVTRPSRNVFIII